MAGESFATHPFATHEVSNQSPPFQDLNLFLSDAALQEAVRREGVMARHEELAAFGAVAGSAEAFDLGRLANENPPRLRRFDQKGFPLDLVEFHPAYHEVMRRSFKAGLHCSAWEHLKTPGGLPEDGAQVARLARLYMTTQTEPGHLCPVTMTNAAVPALLTQPEIAEALLPRVLSRRYDERFRPLEEKAGMTLGMGMTEKQGGTDVRANATTAKPCAAAGPGREYLLVGHKWFLSAPMCDAFLMLAQAPGGLSCFYVLRFLPDGSVNPLRLQRLKEKLGNRANASSEVELQNAHGWLLGEEGRGIATIIEMVTLTRLDCAIASAGQMRLALAMALHHCRHRRVFQKHLVDQPMMAAVLADMAVDVEAATALAFRLARAFERAAADEAEAAWRRLMAPVTKYWVCKMAPALGYEAMECLGGNGYVEEGPAARLYRELPLNAIWEGSGNVMCLDVLRVRAQDVAAVETVLAELDAAARGEPRLEAALADLRALLADPGSLEGRARHFVERLARTAAAGLLRAQAPSSVAEAFIAGRLDGAFRHTYGAGGQVADCRAILERALPPAA
ncbi:acyl-CoA dehydrogenase family protein [Pelagibius marinus]|uniref:acyl-CoA dehydrogenase family protein n=1 Tax=Pelagibius marinus TaxID=2762760 RepID=UPI0018726A73|nr:acyl-CoA dehydrogenase family protein [Pelagibius marinus]